ncbi:Invasion protein B-like protein [Salinisphaera orenii MK-B5]|uniref:Invasion protein B-like protein n=1 Tax=Salinisphaera orenii MK-B5 TaxID=856730 RepID=A0A423PKW2_9GAMM|nr:invasion associated locus B family protein [Salinisphaera orenii]ROO26244.1 Invasion protein B-like protein [Salinisphaera orenii MK-B5]
MSQRLVQGFAVAMLAFSAAFAPGAFAQQQQPSNAENVDVEEFEDWQVRCPENGEQRCEMTQLVNSPESGEPILRIVMGYPPEIDSAAMILILPLGTRLSPGVQFSVDGSEPETFPFQICLQQGCRADFPVDDALRNRMRSGSNAKVSLIGPRGEQIDLNVSLQGFTDADNRIRR